MPHVDEGMLHALLDGELGAAEVLEVQTHFATCPACAARLDEARQLLAETERLVAALEQPAQGGLRPPRPVAGRPMIPLDPVVLIPDNPTATEVRRNRFKVMTWAAAFLVVVGAGFFGLEMRDGGLSGSHKSGKLRIRPEEFTAGTVKPTDSAAPTPRSTDSVAAASAPPGSPPPSAASRQQAGSPIVGGNASADKSAAPSNKAPAPAPPVQTPPAKPQAQIQPPAAKPQVSPPPTPAAKKSGPAPAASAPRQDEAKAAPAPAQAQAEPPAPEAAPADTVDNQPSDSNGGRASGPTDDRASLASRAAKATEELDRERMRQRAAAATEELDRQREQERAAQAAAEAQRQAAAQPAPVPTIDQQARLSSRIGLDEAAHQLGGPLHAIDGMARQLVGLVSPQLVPGADNSRPVVRAVYVDRNGHTLYLDQQRVRPGQLDLPYTPQTGPNGQQVWMSGSVLLVLQGDLAPDSLRALARRVR